MIKKCQPSFLSFIPVMAVFMFLFTKTYSQVNPVPKNIIVLISDGWGINQILATNYWHGVDSTTFQKFPVQYFMSTYQGTQVLPVADPDLEEQYPLCHAGPGQWSWPRSLPGSQCR